MLPQHGRRQGGLGAARRSSSASNSPLTTGEPLYPAAMAPVTRSGGDRDGWGPVRDLAVSDETFGGRVLRNFNNHGRFPFDRHTSSFTLTGLQANVSGRCARAGRGPKLF